MALITAQCPYCRIGAVRAPDRAIGLSASCPNCRSSFTIAVAEEVTSSASKTDSRPISTPDPRPAEPKSPETHPSAILEETQPATAVSVPRPQPTEASAPAPVATEPALVPALIALSFGGIALAGSQLPYGRITLVSCASVGFLLALFSLIFAERERKVPMLATAVNGVGLLFGTLLPGWIGLGGFLPETLDDHKHEVLAVDYSKGARLPAGGGVDADRLAWMLDDVQISVKFVNLIPVDLVGPNNQRRRTKERVLQLSVKIANVGVARPVNFTGWSPPMNQAKVIDSSGQVLKPKTFETGWTPVGATPNPAANLFPGKSSEQTLFFEAPKAFTDLQIELPGAAFGAMEAAVLKLPTTMIGTR